MSFNRGDIVKVIFEGDISKLGVVADPAATINKDTRIVTARILMPIASLTEQKGRTVYREVNDLILYPMDKDLLLHRHFHKMLFQLRDYTMRGHQEW